jgi:hypothetical protein
LRSSLSYVPSHNAAGDKADEDEHESGQQVNMRARNKQPNTLHQQPAYASRQPNTAETNPLRFRIHAYSFVDNFLGLQVTSFG